MRSPTTRAEAVERGNAGGRGEVAVGRAAHPRRGQIEPQVGRDLPRGIVESLRRGRGLERGPIESAHDLDPHARIV